MTIKKISRARDTRAERQLQNLLQATSEEIVEEIAQTKADLAETSAKTYADDQAGIAETNAKAYADSLVNLGGPTANRPGTPESFMMYFDTDLNKPIWYNGTDWVDSTGTIV